MGQVGTGVILALVVVWCFLPFYWMVVLAFRNNANTYDTTPFFSHVTLANFRYAFNTSINQFGRSLINSLIIGARGHHRGHDRRRLRRLCDGTIGLPG